MIADPQPLHSNLSEIRIEGLYGKRSYHIQIPPEPPTRALILYGDNGTGKTTILNIAFRMLNGKHSGHRSALMQIPFKRAEFRFSDGSLVSAERETSRTGAVSMRVVSSSGEPHSFEFLPEELSTNTEPERYQAFLRALRRLNGEVHFLGDNRVAVAKDDEKNTLLLSQLGMTRTDPLDDAIQGAEKRLQRELIAASQIGLGSVNSIYMDLVQQIAGPFPQKESLERVPMAIRLSQLLDRARNFSEFGLVPAFPLERLRHSFNSAPATELMLLEKVLNPYLDGIAAQLDALDAVRSLVSLFVTQLGNFLVDKKIGFSMSNGIEILDEDGDELAPSNLSSGERQLLFLLCTLIQVRDRQALFIIDEPELSLNVKWQRRLVDVLLEISAGSATRFLLATHSIELLTRHRSSVLKIVPERFAKEQLELPS